ncbi:MAG: Na/Pi symporter [Sulfuricurvum sp.]|nr:Na/Pi symporter [Sulfuricurvum sp.]MDP3022832.1 Na/Pi symporter [Sulfuricurvum sp.]MDP3119306.1 Na/Pi symporter [Sulfuricurvum sp.]
MSSAMIEAFASLGLFMFGMIYLEDSLKKAAGASFKKWVKISTNSDAKAVFTGATATALLQSSSVVTLMVLSLTGAGLMSLQSSIGVIFGSNIGSTAAGWVIALIGFKFDIQLISFLMIGFGGIGSVLFGEGKIRHIFGGITGFGLIFLGIGGLKESFSSLAEIIDIVALREQNVLVFLLAGMVLTAIIQSSAASIAIAQSALFIGILGFEHAAVFVIGANVGTTATAIIGAIGGSSDKKRTAVAHILFNVFTGVVAFVLLTPMTWSLSYVGLNQSVEALALFHTIFNILGVIIWFPLIPALTRWLQTKFHVIKPVMTLYIHNVSHTLPALEHEALRKEVIHLGHKVCSFAVAAIHVPPEEGLKHHGSISKILETYKQPLLPSPLERYHELQHLQGEILDYATALSIRIDLPEIRKDFDQTLLMATQLIAASKHIRDILHDIEMLNESDAREMEAFLHELRYQILALCMHYTDWLNGDAEASGKLEALFTKLDNSYKNSIEILNDMITNYKISKQMTVVFMNITHITRNFSKALYKSMNQKSDLYA